MSIVVKGRRVSPRGLFGSIVLAVLCEFLAASAFAGCSLLEGSPNPAVRGELAGGPATVPPELISAVEALRPVYRRISQVSAAQPSLVLCDDALMNAMARGTRTQGALIFYLPLVRLMNGDPDEIASVMGHEFAHLTLDHAQKTEDALRTINRSAQGVANDQYRRTRDVPAAVARAKAYGEAELAKYSRFQEREADDKGFSLAVTLGGYRGEGMMNLRRKLGKLTVSDKPAYLQTHPGWQERYNKADALTTNQEFLDQANVLLAAKRWGDLARLVDRWLKFVPESGAAWYYRGRLIVRQGAARSTITRTFEQSLDRYVDNHALGTLSQEDQAERDDAWYWLCNALFDEGYRRESISCSGQIRSNDKRERFRVRNFGKDHQIVSSAAGPSAGLYMARNPDGGKLITNDPGVAASRGTYSAAAPEWRAQRFP